MSLEPSVCPVLIGLSQEVPELSPDEVNEEPARIRLTDTSSMLRRGDEAEPVNFAGRDELRFDRFAVKLEQSARVAEVRRERRSGASERSPSCSCPLPALFPCSRCKNQTSPPAAGFWFLDSPQESSLSESGGAKAVQEWAGGGATS